jgi:hypothetical protein
MKRRDIHGRLRRIQEQILRHGADVDINFPPSGKAKNGKTRAESRGERGDQEEK